MQSSTLPKTDSPAASSSERRSRRAAREIAPLLITIASGALCYGLFYNRGVWLSVVGFSVAPAERVMQGEMPYRDFFYNYTPGILWVNALLMKLFGATLMTVSAGLFAFKLATLAALYYLARRLTSSWLALIPVALSLGWIGYKYIFGVFPTQYSMLFILLGLIFMLKHDESGCLAWLVMSGAGVAAALVFKYNVGLLLFASGTAVAAARALMLAPSSASLRRLALLTLSRVLAFWAGFAAIAGAMVVYMYANGALGAMVNHFFSFVGAYSDQRAVPLPPVRLLLPALVAAAIAAAGAAATLRYAPRLFNAYLLAVLAIYSLALVAPGRAYIAKDSASALVAYLPPALFAAVFLFLAWQLKSAIRECEARIRWWRENGAMLAVALFALGAYLEVYPRADYYHLVRVLPPVFVLLLMVTVRALRILDPHFRKHLPNPKRAMWLAPAVPLVLLLLVGWQNSWRPHFDARHGFVDRAPLDIPRGRGILVPPKQKEFIEEMVGAIQANSSAGDEIFSFAQRGTGFYFLAERRNPTRFVWWRSVGLNREEREGVLSMIAGRRPRLIILQDSLSDRRVREIVTSNYDLVAKVTDIGIYGRKP